MHNRIGKKVSFQDAEINDLSNAVMLQHKEIELLKKKLALLKKKVEGGTLVKDIKD